MQVQSLEVQSLKTRLKELEMALTQAEEQVRSWPGTACHETSMSNYIVLSPAAESGPGATAKGRRRRKNGGAANSSDGGAEEDSAAGGDSEASCPAEQLPDKHEAGKLPFLFS